MKVYQGKSVFSGVAFGEVFILPEREADIESAKAESPEREWEKYLSAKLKADAELGELFEKTLKEIGSEQADIIDVQRLMLEDGDFNEAVEERIRGEGASAAAAVSAAGKHFSAFFAGLDDPYMKARATDVADVSRRLEDILLGRSSRIEFENPVIVVANDLTPSQTLQFDKSRIRAFVIRQGSSNSHTAILARIMGIPCIVQSDIPLDKKLSGRKMAVDGENGLCYLEPDEKTMATLIDKQEEVLTRNRQLDSVRGLPSVTRDGRQIRLFSNIGYVEDVTAVLENDSEGIGLFRSEFLYLGRSDFPTEEEQFDAYRRVVTEMNGKTVIIRTLDIGADKKVDYFELDDEENPALGLRGVRICIDRPEIFITQLRAIYRASAFGNVALMFPMITSLWELRRCKEVVEQVKEELAREGLPIGSVEVGIMIETPASVIVADDLAKEVDFFSVGTNDLTQYTLALDRQNSKLEKFYDPHHPAVLELLRMTAHAAAENGIWAGICGELAADPEMTDILVNMGYTELSVSPAFTLRLRKRIREIDNAG